MSTRTTSSDGELARLCETTPGLVIVPAGGERRARMLEELELGVSATLLTREQLPGAGATGASTRRRALGSDLVKLLDACASASKAVHEAEAEVQRLLSVAQQREVDLDATLALTDSSAVGLRAKLEEQYAGIDADLTKAVLERERLLAAWEETKAAFALEALAPDAAFSESSTDTPLPAVVADVQPEVAGVTELTVAVPTPRLAPVAPLSFSTVQHDVLDSAAVAEIENCHQRVIDATERAGRIFAPKNAKDEQSAYEAELTERLARYGLSNYTEFRVAAAQVRQGESTVLLSAAETTLIAPDKAGKRRIEDAHDSVLAAAERAERHMAGKGAQAELLAALEDEMSILETYGFRSYGQYVEMESATSTGFLPDSFATSLSAEIAEAVRASMLGNQPALAMNESLETLAVSAAVQQIESEPPVVSAPPRTQTDTSSDQAGLDLLSRLDTAFEQVVPSSDPLIDQVVEAMRMESAASLALVENKIARLTRDKSDTLRHMQVFDALVASCRDEVQRAARQREQDETTRAARLVELQNNVAGMQARAKHFVVRADNARDALAAAEAAERNGASSSSEPADVALAVLTAFGQAVKTKQTLVLDDVLLGCSGETHQRVFARLASFAGHWKIVYLTSDPVVEAWARTQGPNVIVAG